MSEWTVIIWTLFGSETPQKKKIDAHLIANTQTYTVMTRLEETSLRALKAFRFRSSRRRRGYDATQRALILRFCDMVLYAGACASRGRHAVGTSSHTRETQNRKRRRGDHHHHRLTRSRRERTAEEESRGRDLMENVLLWIELSQGREKEERNALFWRGGHVFDETSTTLMARDILEKTRLRKEALAVAVLAHRFART